MVYANDLEINKEVLNSLNAKFSNSVVAKMETPEEESSSSWEDAKEAGNVKGMIGAKMVSYRANLGKRGVISLSKEYSSTLSIGDIQKRLPVAESVMKKAENTRNRIYNSELTKAKEKVRKAGVLNDEVVQAKAEEIVEEWAVTNEEYQKADKEYLTLRTEFMALRNAKDMYIEKNKDLIEAEELKARRRELLASGILEERGIISSEE